MRFENERVDRWADVLCRILQYVLYRGTEVLIGRTIGIVDSFDSLPPPTRRKSTGTFCAAAQSIGANGRGKKAFTT